MPPHVGAGGCGPETDEGETCLEHDADSEEQHELHDHRRRHVRQHVPEARGGGTHTVDGRRFDEQLLLQVLRLSEEDPVQRTEQQHAEHRHHERHVRADRGDESQNDHRARQRHHDLAHAVHESLAAGAAHRPERHGNSDEHRDDGRDARDRECRRGCRHDARQEVATEFVGAQEVRRATGPEGQR